MSGSKMASMNETQDIPEAGSIGELKAYCREHHICARCVHAHVCRVTAACEPLLLVVVSHCLAFEERMSDEAKEQEA